MPRFFRKIIKIRAVDSPNVRLGLEQRSLGLEPTGETVVPGVLSFAEYEKRLATWDRIRVCVGIEAEFYEGAEILMFPPLWLNRANDLARQLRGKPRKAKALGVDAAEGGDDSAWAVVDEFGLIDLVSLKTQDTSVIVGRTIALMNYHAIPAGRVVFDRGGGGKQHADRLEQMGYNVRSVGFGEGVVPDPQRGSQTIATRIDQREERYSYTNRRAQLYGELRLLLDPSYNEAGFAIPEEYAELRRQLSPIPLTYDGEGRLRLLPKHRRDTESKGKTLTELIGCSPDEADALALACHGMLHAPKEFVAGPLV